MEDFIQKIQNLNYAMITINYHPTDMDDYKLFFNTILLPYAMTASIYFITTEYKDTQNEHCHIILSYGENESIRDFDKIKRKLKSKKVTQNLLKLTNTKLEHAIKVDKVNSTVFDKYKSIGYLLKHGSENLISNVKDQKILDMVYQSYITAMKKPIVQVEHQLQYKTIGKGELLLHMYDEHMKVSPYRS